MIINLAWPMNFYSLALCSRYTNNKMIMAIVHQSLCMLFVITSADAQRAHIYTHTHIRSIPRPIACGHFSIWFAHSKWPYESMTHHWWLLDNNNDKKSVRQITLTYLKTGWMAMVYDGMLKKWRWLKILSNSKEQASIEKKITCDECE